MTKIVNLTPHEINIIGEQNISIPPSGQVARVVERTETIGDVNGIPIIHKTFGTVEGLPDAQPNTVYVVSLLTAQATHRTDVLAVGEVVRNDKGQVVGTKSFSRV